MSTLDDLLLPHPSDSWMCACYLLPVQHYLSPLSELSHVSKKKKKVLDEHAGCVHVIVLRLKPFNPEISNMNIQNQSRSFQTPPNKIVNALHHCSITVVTCR